MNKHQKSPPTRAKSRTSSPVDALALLRADHKTVADLFAEFEKRKARLDVAKKRELAGRICGGLTVHATIEEEIFYPAVREHCPDAGDLLDEADVEHGSLKELISHIESGAGDDGHFEAQVKVLGEYVKHHVREEQNELFPLVRASDLDLRAVGLELANRKAELESASPPKRKSKA